MPGTNKTIPGVPRFGTQGPANQDDWVNLYRWLTKLKFQTTIASGSADDLAATPATNFPSGSLFVVLTSLGEILYVQNAGAWDYLAGELSGVLADLPAGLTMIDRGLPFNVTDYAHQLAWTGSAWEWGPADGRGAGQGPILFEVDPSPITGWHLYDGTSGVSYLKSDGTLGTVNLPDFTSADTFLAGGVANTAVTPTLDAGTIPAITRRAWFRQ